MAPPVLCEGTMRSTYLLTAVLLSLIGGCVDYRMYPEAGWGSANPDAIDRMGINGQGIEVRTWIKTEGYRSRAATTGRTNVDDPKPLLVEAAQRIAKLNCPAGYQLIDESAFADFSYEMQ